jgi:hypothetical protein
MLFSGEANTFLKILEAACFKAFSPLDGMCDFKSNSPCTFRNKQQKDKNKVLNGNILQYKKGFVNFLF